MSLLLQNKLRQLIIFVRNYWVYELAALLVIGIVIQNYTLITLLLGTYRFTLYFIIAFLYFYLLFLRKTPLILVNPASIHLLRGTKMLQRIFAAKISMQFLFCTALVLVIFIFFYSYFEMVLFVNTYISLILCSLLSWSRYNNRYHYVFYFLILVLEIVLLFSTPIFGIVVNVACIVLWMILKPSVLWEKYYADMVRIYRISTIAARADFAQMQILATENSIKESYRLSFTHLLLKKPLLAKSIVIDTFRTPYYQWVIVVVTLATALAIYSFDLFYPFAPLLFVIVLASSYSYVIKMYSIHVRYLIRKIREGLLIPYSLIDISINNTIIPSIIILAAATVVCLICNTSFIIFFFEVVFLVIATLLSILTSAVVPGKARVIDMLSYAFVLIVVAICHNPFPSLL